MIAKKFRLPAKEFPKKAEWRIASPFFVFKISRNKMGYNRFAVVISAKTEKKSVRRHFWKRAILDHLKNKQNLNKDFLITILPEIKKVTKKEILAELDKIFSKI